METPEDRQLLQKIISISFSAFTSKKTRENRDAKLCRGFIELI